MKKSNNPEKLTFREFLVCEAFQYGNSQVSVSDGKRSKNAEMSIANDSSIYPGMKVDGWEFICTIHAAAQAFDRRPEFKSDDWKQFHQKVAKKLNSWAKISINEKIFYSQKMKQGYVTSVNVDKKTVRIITVLPKEKNNPAPGTDKIMMEHAIIMETVNLD